eukprot:Nk52_evm30s2474 gene=Nk52_evmTU30s2474
MNGTIMGDSKGKEAEEKGTREEQEGMKALESLEGVQLELQKCFAMIERCCFGQGRLKISDASKEKVLLKTVYCIKTAREMGCHLKSVVEYDLVFTSLRMLCQNRSVDIRAAAIRTVRLLLENEEDVAKMNDSLIPLFVSRSFERGGSDVEKERLEAIKCIAAVIELTQGKGVPQIFIMSLCVVAEAFNDMMCCVCVELLCELLLLNPKAAVLGGAVKVMVKVMLFHHLSDMGKYVLSVLLCIMNYEEARKYLRPEMDIEMLLSPFTDAVSEDQLRENDSVMVKLQNSKAVILQLLRSWGGALYLFSSPRGMKPVISLLSSPNKYTTSTILDMIFEVFQIRDPIMSDNFLEALGLSISYHSVNGREFEVQGSKRQDSEMASTIASTPGPGAVYSSPEPSIKGDKKQLLTPPRPSTSVSGSSGRKDVIKKILKHYELTNSLPPRWHRSVNLSNGYYGILLLMFLKAGLTNSLIEVIKCNNEVFSVRATILLAELLHLAHILLPKKIAFEFEVLPDLMKAAASFDGDEAEALDMLRERSRAHAAINNLDKYKQMDKNKSSSLLDFHLELLFKRQKSAFKDQENEELFRLAQLMRTISTAEDSSDNLAALVLKSRPVGRVCGNEHLSTSVIASDLKKTSDMEMDDTLLNYLIRESTVLQTKEFFKWNWNIVLELIHGPLQNPRKLSEAIESKFLKRVLSFFRPYNAEFCMILSEKANDKFPVIGCQLVKLLLFTEDGCKMLRMSGLFAQISECLGETLPGPTEKRQSSASHMSSSTTFSKFSSSHFELADAPPRITKVDVFSQRRLSRTYSSEYFTFIGIMSSTSEGLLILEQSRIISKLYAIVRNFEEREELAKLLLNSLHFGKGGYSQAILQTALTSSSVACRRYCTRLMRTFFRARVENFSEWGVEFLVSQLYDTDEEVNSIALSVLQEAADDSYCLRKLIQFHPALVHLGEEGTNLMYRTFAVESGLRFYFEIDPGIIRDEIEDWFRCKNVAYSRSVERTLLDTFIPLNKCEEIGTDIDRRGQYDVNEKGKCADLSSNFKYDSFSIRSFAGANSRSDISEPPEAKMWQKNDEYTAVGGVFCPVHLYAELGKTAHGCNILEERDHVEMLVECLKQRAKSPFNYLKRDSKAKDSSVEGAYDPNCVSDVKACVWALANLGSTSFGFKLISKYCDIVGLFVSLALHSSHLSLRGTCFYAMGFFTLCVQGALAVEKCDWELTRDEKGVFTGVCVPRNLDSFLNFPRYQFEGSWARYMETSLEGHSYDNSMQTYSEDCAKSSRTGSVTSLRSNDLENGGSKKASYAYQGSLAGVKGDQTNVFSSSVFNKRIAAQLTADDIEESSLSPDSADSVSTRDSDSLLGSDRFSNSIPASISHSFQVGRSGNKLTSTSSFIKNSTSNRSQASSDDKDIDSQLFPEEQLERDIAKLLENLSNPLQHGAAKRALKRHHERLPMAFSNPSLYGYALKLLGLYHYTLPARRQIHELFMHYVLFDEDNEDILRHHADILIIT